MPLGLAVDTVIEEQIQSIPTVLKAARTILTANTRVKNLTGLGNSLKTHVYQGFSGDSPRAVEWSFRAVRRIAPRC
jgi:hypothetical protein